MSEVRHCESHGFHEGERCPACGAVGTPVLDADRRRRLSRFVSGALRHFPGDAGLDLDERGWTDRGALEDVVADRYGWADAEALAAVVATDPKGRFEVDDADGTGENGHPDQADDSGEADDSDEADGERIRAAYGHSVDVDLEPAEGPVPDVLHHGTAPDVVPPILDEGIRPMTRQLVHLSGSVGAARSVGARHADEPVVLRVDAAGMLADGHRITKRGTGVYTTEHVPPAYVERSE